MIYTRTGDDGMTSLSGGKRVPKTSLRVEAYGSIDELISWIGLLRSFRENDARSDILVRVQDQLMKCACALAAGENKDTKDITPDQESIKTLEKEIDRMDSKLPHVNKFVLPGGHILVSYCHIARCVCRRVECTVLKLKNIENVHDLMPKYLNRLSDYLFVLSRMIALELDIQEIRWPL